MYYQSILIGLFATSVLAAKLPWVSSYNNPSCQSPGAGDAATIQSGGCTKFNPKYDHVLVNFGSTIDETDQLTAFTDDNCKIPATDTLNSSEAGHRGYCVSMEELGGKWGSMMWTLFYENGT